MRKKKTTRQTARTNANGRRTLSAMSQAAAGFFGVGSVVVDSFVLIMIVVIIGSGAK